MKVLKICIGTWENASRDKRELSVVRELGASVEVVAKGEVSGQVDDISGFPVIRLSTRPVKWLPVSANRVLSVFMWAGFVRKMEIDVISGHDLTALFIGWLSNFGKRDKAKLIYDSHEFELGLHPGCNKVFLWLICHMERFLMKRCVFSIMVNDTIADEVQRIHHLDKRPIVVRNVPSYWELDFQKIRTTRAELLKQLRLPKETFLVMYHGGIMNDRGIENMLKAVAKLPKVAAIILGNGQKKYLEVLHNLCKQLGMEDKVLFHPAVPLEQLRNYVGAVEAGIITVLPTLQSYYYMLPNKLFENIQSLTPVIVSDFPTIGSLVDQYEIGLRVNPENVDEIAATIERMQMEKKFYMDCKEHLKRAKEELCWEKEKAVLKEAYSRIL